MKLQTKAEDDWLAVFSVSGEMDAYTAPEFRDRLTEVLDEGLVWILVDLGEVDYIDSVALGILIGGAKRATERGGELAVVCQRANLLRIFDISGTRELLNVCEEQAESRRLLEQRRAATIGSSGPEGGQ